MYGDCRKGEVADQLRRVAWLPHRGGGTILATRVNGVAEKLEQISAELEKLPPSITRYAVPSAGVYSCRKIAASGLISMHSYGAAIDLNDKFGDYWLWNKKSDGTFNRRHRIPDQIVDIFERFDPYGVASGIILIRFISSTGRKSSIWRGKTGPGTEERLPAPSASSAWREERAATCAASWPSPMGSNAGPAIRLPWRASLRLPSS